MESGGCEEEKRLQAGSALADPFPRAARALVRQAAPAKTVPTGNSIVGEDFPPLPSERLPGSNSALGWSN